MRSTVLFFLAYLLSASSATASETNADALTFREIHLSPIYGDIFDRPSAVVLSPEGNDLYFSSRFSQGITHFRRLFDGTLELESFNPVGGDVFSVNHMTISPDGRFVFAILAGDGNRIATLARNAQTGAISPVHEFADGDSEVEQTYSSIQLNISPDGRHLYVKRQYSSFFEPGPALTVFSIDNNTGKLSEVQQLYAANDFSDGLLAGVFLAFSPDGRHLYSPVAGSPGIAIFARDATTGVLTYSATYTASNSQMFGLAFSPDGRHAYVIAGFRTVYIASRDDSSGLLTTIDTIEEDMGNTFTENPIHFVVAPDGRRVYLITGNPTHVSAFDRNPSTGLLTFLEELDDGIVGTFILRDPIPPVVSSDSRSLYVAGESDGALAAFVADRPNLPCLDSSAIEVEWQTLQQVYALDDDVDQDGLPEHAAIALILEASCGASATDVFDEAITNAYLLNKATFGTEAEVYASEIWTPYSHVMPTLLLISSSMDVYLNESFPFDQSLQPFYVAVNCASGQCEPANARGVLSPDSMEPFTGSADPDADGFTNADEWANVLARDGSAREFGVSALDPENDGTRAVSFNGSSSCFIATAAYGTPLAAELDALRAFRDSRLLTNLWGSAFSDAYYRLSPPAANLIATRPVFGKSAKFAIALWLAPPWRVLVLAGFVALAIRTANRIHPRNDGEDHLR